MSPKKRIEEILYHFYEVEVDYAPQNDNAYFKGLGLIEIDSLQTERDQYYTLLHEFAHVVAMQKKDFTYMGDGGIIINESQAWHYSEVLIDQYELPICELSWEAFKRRSVDSYVKREEIESKNTVHNRV